MHIQSMIKIFFAVFLVFTFVMLILGYTLILNLYFMYGVLLFIDLIIIFVLLKNRNIYARFSLKIIVKILCIAVIFMGANLFVHYTFQMELGRDMRFYYTSPLNGYHILLESKTPFLQNQRTVAIYKPFLFFKKKLSDETFVTGLETKETDFLVDFTGTKQVKVTYSDKTIEVVLDK